MVDLRERTVRGIWESRAARESSRLNMSSSVNWDGVGCKRGARERERASREEDKRKLRRCMATMAGFLGMRSWAKGGP